MPKAHIEIHDNEDVRDMMNVLTIRHLRPIRYYISWLGIIYKIIRGTVRFIEKVYNMFKRGQLVRTLGIRYR